jgi:hypothetical protein
MRTFSIIAKLIICVLLASCGGGKPDPHDKEKSQTPQNEEAVDQAKRFVEMSKDERQAYLQKQINQKIAEQMGVDPADVNKMLGIKEPAPEVKAPKGFKWVNNSGFPDDRFYDPGQYWVVCRQSFKPSHFEIESLTIGDTVEQGSKLVSQATIVVKINADSYASDGVYKDHWMVSKVASQGQSWTFSFELSTMEQRYYGEKIKTNLWNRQREIREIGQPLTEFMEERGVMHVSQKENLLKIMNNRKRQQEAVVLREKKLEAARVEKEAELAKIKPILDGFSQAISGDKLSGVFGEGDNFVGAIHNFKVMGTEVEGQLSVPYQNIDVAVKGKIRVQKPYKSRGQLIPENILLEMEILDRGQWKNWERFTYYPEQAAFVSRNRKDTVVGYIPLNSEGQQALEGHVAQMEKASQSYAAPWKAEGADLADFVMIQTGGQGGFRYDLLNLSDQQIIKNWWNHHQDPIPVKGKEGYYFLGDKGDYNDVTRSWPFGVYDGEATVVQLMSANGVYKEHSPFGRHRDDYMISNTLQSAYRIIDGNIYLYSINWDDFSLSEGMQITDNSVFEEMELLGWFKDTLYFRNETKLGEMLITVDLIARSVEEQSMPFVLSNYAHLHDYDRGRNRAKLPGLDKAKIGANPSGALIFKRLEDGILQVRNLLSGEDYRLKDIENRSGNIRNSFLNDYTLHGYARDQFERKDSPGFGVEFFPEYLDLLHKTRSNLEGFGRVAGTLIYGTSGSTNRYLEVKDENLYWTLAPSKAFRSRIKSKDYSGEDNDVFSSAAVLDRISGEQYTVETIYEPQIWIDDFRFVYSVYDGSFSELGTWIYDCKEASQTRISVHTTDGKPYVSPDLRWLVYGKNNGDGIVVHNLKTDETSELSIFPMGLKSVTQHEVDLNRNNEKYEVWIGDRFIQPLGDEKLFEGEIVDGAHLTLLEKIFADLKPENDLQRRRIKALYTGYDDDLDPEGDALGGFAPMTNPSKFIAYALTQVQFDGDRYDGYLDPQTGMYNKSQIVLGIADKSLFVRLRDPYVIYRKTVRPRLDQLSTGAEDPEAGTASLKIHADFYAKAAASYYCNLEQKVTRTQTTIFHQKAEEQWRKYPTKDNPVSWIRWDQSNFTFEVGPPLEIRANESIDQVIEDSLESAFRISCDPRVFEDFLGVSGVNSSPRGQSIVKRDQSGRVDREGFIPDASKSGSVSDFSAAEAPTLPVESLQNPVPAQEAVNERVMSSEENKGEDAQRPDLPASKGDSGTQNELSIPEGAPSVEIIRQAYEDRLAKLKEVSFALADFRVVEVTENDGPGFIVVFIAEYSGVASSRDGKSIERKHGQSQKGWLLSQRGNWVLLDR